MPKKKKHSDAFQSIQILSDKAQKLWDSARKKVGKKQSATAKPREFPANEREGDIEVLVHISTSSVVKAAFTILAVVVGAWLLFQLRDKIIILVLAFFLSIVIDPAVRHLEGWKVPRGLSVLIVYFLFLGIAVFLIVSLIPIVATQLQSLARLLVRSTDAFLQDPQIQIPFASQAINQQMTEFIRLILQNLNIQDRASALFQFGQQLSTTAQYTVNFLFSVAGGVVNFFVNFILVLVLAFFIQIERESVFDYFRLLLPRSYRKYLDMKSEAVHEKMSQWIKGQLTLSLTIGVLVFIALLILGMGEYALTLAILAAFTEFIPVAGPIIAALPALLIAISQNGFVWMLIVGLVYYAIQWCENNLLVPLIMRRAVGLSPIAILFAMLVGISFPDTIHPILGVILAVPTTTIITIFIRDLQEARRRE